jgi:hypothetical protein
MSRTWSASILLNIDFTPLRNQQVTQRYPKSCEEAAEGGWCRGDTSPRRGCCGVAGRLPAGNQLKMRSAVRR